MTQLALIAALDRGRAIGRGNQLLWHCREDQRHFKAATLGWPVIMGRRTWDSLPERFRPLPGRRNIVLTRNPAWQASGAERVGSWEEAQAAVAGSEKAFVIGGAALYALALASADELILTEIDARFEGADAFFPEWERSQFHEASRTAHADEEGRRFEFVSYKRRG